MVRVYIFIDNSGKQGFEPPTACGELVEVF